jgi:hypothetical protein
MMQKVSLSRGWWVRAGIALALAMAAVVSQVRPTFAWSWPTKPVPTVVTEPVDTVNPDDQPVFYNSVNWGG